MTSMDDVGLTAAVAKFAYAVLPPETEPACSPSLGRCTLGIEVTVPRLAERCGLGNIDPQHAGGNSDRTAIEEALTVRVPPIGACLVTVRPDADSVRYWMS